MTSDIIRMAQEAGFETQLIKGRIHGFDRDGDYTEELECFAELVRKDYSTTHANLWLDRIHKFMLSERASMMQLFTDPENQPTQHGTVTVEYMQREIAAERERIIAANAPEIEKVNAHIKALKDELAALRELAAGRCTIQKVIDELGPMSLWSKDGLEREIAKAVAAEREQGQKWFDAVTAQHKQAILAEREACAKLCEGLEAEYESVCEMTSLLCSQLIRARSNT